MNFFFYNTYGVFVPQCNVTYYYLVYQSFFYVETLKIKILQPFERE